MQVKSLMSMMQFKGEVASKRQIYYLFESKKGYVLFSLSSPNTGNFSVVDPDAVHSAEKIFAGKRGITRKTFEEHPKMTRLIKKGSFDALLILYVLVALGKAKIDGRIKSRTLYFNIKSKKK